MTHEEYDEYEKKFLARLPVGWIAVLAVLQPYTANGTLTGLPANAVLAVGPYPFWGTREPDLIGSRILLAQWGSTHVVLTRESPEEVFAKMATAGYTMDPRGEPEKERPE